MSQTSISSYPTPGYSPLILHVDLVPHHTSHPRSSARRNAYRIQSSFASQRGEGEGCFNVKMR